MSKPTKLTSKQRALLQGAMRRYTVFHPGESLTEAWTGLGSRTTYKPVLNAGLMEWVREPKPRCTGWLRLTEAGATIVQEWIAHSQEVPMPKRQESFPVLSISREDVNHAIGYNLGPELTDDQMEGIADKFGDALQGLEPWDILADVIESWLPGEEIIND